MAVVHFEEKIPEEPHVSQGNRLEYTRFFQAICTRDEDGWPELLRKRPDLAPYASHPRHPNLLVKDFDPVRRDDTVAPEIVWDIEVSYSTEIEFRKEDPNPLARPAKVSLGSSRFSEFVLTDADGDPRLNTAGELLEPKEVERSRLVFHVAKNLAFVPRWLLEYADDRLPVNADTIRLKGLTFAPEHLRLENFQVSDEQEENDTLFVTLEFDLAYNTRTWRDFEFNVGFQELLEEEQRVRSEAGTVRLVRTQKLVQLTVPKADETGNATGEVDLPDKPLFLSRKGRAFRDEAGNIRPPKPEEVVTLEFQLHPRLPFSVLPLR